MSSLWQDVRFSFRTLSKSPGFTLVAVLTMALGIGALSSIFSVVNAVLLRELPYKDAHRLVLLDGLSLKDETQRWSISYLDFLDLQERLRQFDAIAARTESRNFALRTDQGPEMIKGEIVSSPYFPILGVKAAHGRTFVREEDRAPGGQRVVLISNDLWHSRYGAEEIVGRTIALDDLQYTVVGILPEGFRGLTDEAQIWLPLSAATALGERYTGVRGFRWLYAVGRLKEGVSLEQGQRDLDRVMRQLEADFKENEGVRVKATELSEAWFGELRRKLLILLAGGMLLLLIVCTNLANLLLARFVARRRDLSLRMALGAGRRGLVRQILTESVLLALLGCVAGLLVARWSSGLLVRASGIQLRSFVHVNVDLVVVGVILLVSLAAGLLFGLVPALVLSTRLRLYEIFNDTGRRGGGQGDSHHRFQNMLIVGEVALALVLLVCAGLMTKGLQRLQGTELGFDGSQILSLRMTIKGDRYKENPAVWNLVSEVREQVKALPGVHSVALEGPNIPTDDWTAAAFNLEGRPESEGPVVAVVHFISPDYFETLGIQVPRGREFQESDIHGAQPVAMINESMASDLWPGQSPLGKQILLGGDRKPKNPNPWLTVVGVVRDVRHDGLLRDDTIPPHNVYLALLQQVPRTPPALGLLVRTEGDPAQLTSPVADRLEKIAPDLPIYDPMTMEDRLAAQTRQNRSFVVLMSLFALFALALAAVGVYGVVSYSVANRTQEIGVRMALGAQLRDVLRLVVGQGSRLALVGVALGLLLAALVTPVLQTWLFGVSPLDKVILAGMSLLLLGVAVAASYIPARRAAKVAPFQALRLE